MTVFDKDMKAPQIFRTESGTVVVIWMLDESRFYNQTRTISVYSNTSFDDGNTWEEARCVFSVDGSLDDDIFVSVPQVDFHGEGPVYLTYRTERNGYPKVYVAHSLDYGLTWEDSVGVAKYVYDDETLVEAEAPPAYKTCIDSFGRVYTLWRIRWVMNDSVYLDLSYNLDGDEHWSRINLGPAEDFKDANITCVENDHIYLV